MRSETEIKELVLDFAQQDERVRAVLLSGSRTNPNVKPDVYQDFDILFIVRELASFTSNHHWTNFLGEKIVWQLPQEMGFGNDPDNPAFPYLMLFQDGNRIDLTLYPAEQIQKFHAGSLAIVWLDKDQILSTVREPDESDYHITRPTEKEYLDTCNEFWWVSTYVAKGLLRNEITYAKQMLEMIVRPMFMRLIGWKIGSENEFSVSVGQGGKWMARYLLESLLSRILKTYADGDIENNWKSLFMMTELFAETSNELSIRLNFRQDKVEQKNTIAYLRQAYPEQIR